MPRPESTRCPLRWAALLVVLFSEGTARADYAPPPPPCYRHDAGAACVVWGEHGICQPAPCRKDERRGYEVEPCMACVLPPDPSFGEGSPGDAGASDAGAAPPRASVAKVPPGARGCASAGDVAPPLLVLCGPVIALLAVLRRRRGRRA